MNYGKHIWFKECLILKCKNIISYMSHLNFAATRWYNILRTTAKKNTIAYLFESYMPGAFPQRSLHSRLSSDHKWWRFWGIQQGKYLSRSIFTTIIIFLSVMQLCFQNGNFSELFEIIFSTVRICCFLVFQLCSYLISEQHFVISGSIIIRVNLLRSFLRTQFWEWLSPFRDILWNFVSNFRFLDQFLSFLIFLLQKKKQQNIFKIYINC